MESQPTSPTRRLPRRPRTGERPLAAHPWRPEADSPRQRASAPPGPVPGQPSGSPWLLAGRYRVEEVIGRGGMSTVYRATDTVLDRPVAVKVLLAVLANGDPSHIERFRREARAVAALHHPGVVKIYDTGVDEGRHFLVMEYVDGRSLDAVLRDGRALPPPEAVRIAVRVAETLAAAHGAGILHRDVKPGNVMLGSDGQVHVLDFGIARPLQEATLTQPASAMGTAAYMAPERVRGEPGDERSDIYALGCLLYAMLAGRPPFMADDQVAVLHQQAHAEPPSPRRHGARIGPSLELLVLSMLAKDPADRPQSARVVATALRQSLLDGASGAPGARPWGVAGGPGGARATGNLLSGDRGHRRWAMPLALAAAVAVVVAVVAVLAAGGSRAPASRPATTHRHATGSYHEPVTHTVSAPLVTTTPGAPTPAKPAAQGPGAGPKGKGPDGAGPPGHDKHHGGPPGRGGGPPGHDGGGD